MEHSGSDGYVGSVHRPHIHSGCGGCCASPEAVHPCSAMSFAHGPAVCSHVSAAASVLHRRGCRTDCSADDKSSAIGDLAVLPPAVRRHLVMDRRAKVRETSQVCIGEYLDGCAAGSAACPCCQRPLSVDLTAAGPVRSLTHMCFLISKDAFVILNDSV